MPKTDCDDRTLAGSLSRLFSRQVRDSEIAKALDLPVSTYSKRKNKTDFPTFDELRQVAARMGADETLLQVDFGYLDVTSLNNELQQRYAAYRNAIEVMESMHYDVQAGKGRTKTAPKRHPADPGEDGRPPRISDARPLRPL